MRTLFLAVILTVAVAALGASAAAMLVGAPAGHGPASDPAPTSRIADPPSAPTAGRASTARAADPPPAPRAGTEPARPAPEVARQSPTPLPVLVAAIPRATATALAWWADTLSGDSYRRVRDFPGRTAGDSVAWTCAVAGRPERDPRTGALLVRCAAGAGTPPGEPGGRDVVLRLPPGYGGLDASLDPGAVVVVWGTVMAPYGGPGRATPQVLVQYITPASHAVPAPR